MENQVKVKCPRCGGTNVIVHNRGYSLLQGIVLAVVLVLVDWVFTLVGVDYEGMSDAGQTGFVLGLLVKGVPIFLFGLLLGLIGKNKLVARCLNCKNKFDPALGVAAMEEESVIVPRGEGSISPTKSDVREFQEIIKEYKKEHKTVDEEWLEDLIKEYNAKFTEDFHQYL